MMRTRGNYGFRYRPRILEAEPPPPPGGEPAPIDGLGYTLVKDWDFQPGGNVRTLAALDAEFFPLYERMGHIQRFGGQNNWHRWQPFNSVNHVFTSEGLALTASLQPGQPFPANDDVGTLWSGMIESKWLGRYGYFESVQKAPKSPGSFPAYWIFNQDHVDGNCEIDIHEVVEGIGADVKTTHSFHNCFPATNRGALTFSHANAHDDLGSWPNARYTPGFDYSHAFHKFGLLWEADRVRFYIDDVLIYDYVFHWVKTLGANAGQPQTNAYVMICYAIGDGGTWVGPPTPAIVGTSFIVKYSRIWQA